MCTNNKGNIQLRKNYGFNIIPLKSLMRIQPKVSNKEKRKSKETITTLD